MTAVKKDGLSIQFVFPKSLRTNDICLEAVKQNPESIKYIENPSLEVCLEAVRRRPTVLCFIHNQTQKICLEAMNTNDYSKAVKFIDWSVFDD